MKKLLVGFFAALTWSGAVAQITMRSATVVDKPVVCPLPFDSLTNIVNEHRVAPKKGVKPDMLNFKRYIGQQIFFLPKSSHVDASGKEDQLTKYTCFYRLNLAPTEVNYTYSETTYVKGKAKTEQKPRVLTTDCYLPVFQAPNFQNHGDMFYTPADSVEGRYFVILDVGVGSVRSRWGAMTAQEGDRYLHTLNCVPLSGESETKYSGQSYSLIFTMQPVAGGESFLMVLRSDYPFTERGSYRVAKPSFPPPMLLVSFFEKMQRSHVGTSFVAEKQINGLVDINTGSSVIIPVGSEWKCTDLSLLELSEGYMQPCYVLENGQSAVKFPLKSPSDSNADMVFPYAFISKVDHDERIRLEKLVAEERQRELQAEEERRIQVEKENRAFFIAQFGENYGKCIANKQVVVGMTREMCEFAWGSPNWINTTTVSGLRREQWVYGYGNYLYFDNGKLTAIQNHL